MLREAEGRISQALWGRERQMKVWEKGGQGSKKRAPEHIADEQTIKIHKLLKMIPFPMEFRTSNN